MIYNIYLNKIVKVFKLSVYILTGQIGSGKTEAVKIFKKLGFSCFCADEVVRELYKEKNVLLNINRIYPDSVINGTVNRELLRKKIFTDIEVMEKIENYIQPLVFIEFKKIEKIYKNKLIFIIPIINNSSFFKNHKIIYINSNEEIRKKRLLKRKNYNINMINNIIKYQKRIDKYKNNSKHIIENNSTLSDLEKKIKKIINYL